MDGATRRLRGKLTVVPDPPAVDALGGSAVAAELDALMAEVARGNHDAFASLYDSTCDKVFGLVRRVVRDRSQAEEVTQEVYLQAWRQASRFDRRFGTGLSWLMTLAHRRAVDRVRSAEARAHREQRAARQGVETAHDQVAEAVEQRLDVEQVRRCLEGLTSLQRESVTLAYYRGYTYSEVGTAIGVPLGTIKTRMRDGLIRLRDCMGVSV